MTDKDKVRLLIDDTASVKFTDTQIQVFLDMAGGSILTAAGYALEAWAAALVGSITSEKIGDYSYTKKEAEGKLRLAKEYKEQDAAKPYLTISEMDLTGIEDTTVSEDIE